MTSRLLFGAGVVLGLATIAPADSLFSGEWTTSGSVLDQAATFPMPFRDSGGLFISTGDNTAPQTTSAGVLQGIVGTGLYVGGRRVDAGGPQEGSAAWVDFTGEPGDVLTVQWDFITAEGAAELAGFYSDAELDALTDRYVNDYAFVAIGHNGTARAWRLADDFTPDLKSISDDSDERFRYHTGLRTFTYMLPADGAYRLFLGVLDGSDFRSEEIGIYGESALLVESVELTPAGASPVPTPMAAAGGVALLCGLAAARRRRV